MNFESELYQYYINSDKKIKEHYYLYEILAEEQKYLILKKMNMDIAKIFESLDKRSKAKAIRECNSLKYIKQCLTNADHRDIKVSYCKDRFCPICSHLKSKKHTEMLGTLFDSMGKDNNYKNSYLLFVTLTKKNSTVGTLKNSVEESSKALRKIMTNDPLFKPYKTTKKNGKTVVNKPLCQGSIIKKECTAKYNPKTKQIEFNDHIHLILMVRKDYWNQKSKQWSHKRLGKIWKDALGVDYTPIVWVSLIKNGELKSNHKEEFNIEPKEAKKEKNNFANLDASGALKEIAKYEAKESDMLPMFKNGNGEAEINWNDAKTILNELHIAYHNKTTITFTGSFRKQKQRLFGNKKANDLVEEVTGSALIDMFKRSKCRKCGAPTEDQLYNYNWKTRSYDKLSKYSVDAYKHKETIKAENAMEAKKERKRIKEILAKRPAPPIFDKIEVWEEDYSLSKQPTTGQLDWNCETLMPSPCDVG